VSRREDYRQKAVECAEAAEGASELAERIALLEIAQAWLRLADHLPNNAQPELPLRDGGSVPNRDNGRARRFDGGGAQED
jgi:hypothetical protein